IGKFFRRDQNQTAEPHGFHRACRGADIAGMAGTHQHDADVGERARRVVAVHVYNARLRHGAKHFVLRAAAQAATRRTAHFPPRFVQPNTRLIIMHPMLNTAVKAARQAGSIITRGARDLDILTVTKKRHNDYVTEIDKAAEAAIIETLLKAYPGHAILAEESGTS